MGREISEMTTFTSEDRQAAQKEMNNKPVAWMTEEALKGLSIPFLSQVTLMTALKASQVDDFNIPLYTHPVKEYKEPSVKEIDDLWLDVVNNIPANDNRPREWHFARAILRKAQEK